jgi:hypothetical protein
MSREILRSSVETPKALRTSRYSPPWPKIDDDDDHQGSSPEPLQGNESIKVGRG